MMKYMYWLGLVPTVFIILSGCISQPERIEILDDIAFIEVSESEGTVGMNLDLTGKITSPRAVGDVTNILLDAEMNEEAEFHDTPDYDLLIRYENGETQSLKLSIGDTSEGQLIHAGYEDTVYVLSESAVQHLERIISEADGS